MAKRLFPLVLFACHPPAAEPETGTPAVAVEAKAEEEPAAAEVATKKETAAEPEPAAEPVAPPREPVTLITDGPTLAAMPGLSFGQVVLGMEAKSTAELSADPAFRSIGTAIAADLRRDARDDPKAGVGTSHPHRQFDRRWLNRDNVRLDLVAVVNRIDRHPFAPEHCGETRLIYRLAYEASLPQGDVESRLPMTFNVVLWQDGEDCQDVANRWMMPEGLDVKAQAEWLRRDEGPLAASRLGASQLEAVEVNLQSVRWPSAVRPRMAGHAEYLLRVFHRQGDRFVSVGLENTPDAERLRRNPRLKAELVAWLNDPANAAALDDGVAVIPDRFLARRGLSVTPRGFARLGNRPYAQFLSEADLQGIDYSKLQHAKSPAAMIRRLDGLTCGGCHESRSVAGFHIVGAEPQGRELDAVAVPISPHLGGDLQRREAYLVALASGQPGEAARPLSEHDANQGGYGSHCSLGDAGFAAWTCADGLRCRDLGDPQLGTCVMDEPAGAGDPCEVGTVRANADPHRDRAAGATSSACRDDMVCNGNSVGFPEGMCTTSCSEVQAGETCGAIVSLRPFNLCVGQRRPFPVCVEENARPAGMRACDADNPCRDDYICARSPFDAPEDEGGACLPPYFLFQLRVDGHVM
ncbi:MAG: hypothetical protein AAF799_27060 [Myxococcota bacterium]